MKNKFIRELAHKLLLVASFEEMKGVLEDYSGFMGESEGNESPKEIVNSLGINKTKGYVISIIYFVLLVISFFAMDGIRVRGFDMLGFCSIVLLLMCVLFLFGTYSIWGKKLSLVSQYSSLKQKDNIFVIALSTIPFIIIVGFSIFMILSLNSFISHSTQMLTGFIIDISFLVLFVCGIISLVLMFLKGSKYFLSTTISYCAFACLVQMEVLCMCLSDISLVQKYTLFILSFLTEFLIFVIIALILNKKLGVLRK